MQNQQSAMHSLLESIEAESHSSLPDGLAMLEAHAGAASAQAAGQVPDSEASIFSQLLERILQGYALKLEDDGDESGASLEILLDGVSDSVLIMSPPGHILEANRGLREKQLRIGRTIRIPVPPQPLAPPAEVDDKTAAR